jgi:hypothetical protein
MSSHRSAAEIRAALKHPVIDADDFSPRFPLGMFRSRTGYAASGAEAQPADAPADYTSAIPL